MVVTAQLQAGVPAWVEQDGAVIIPRRVSRFDRVRLAMAWVVTLAAIGFVGVGIARPALVGFKDIPGLLYVTGPALILGALLHLLLISTGIRRPTAVFSADGVYLHGTSLKRDQVTRVYIDRSPYGQTTAPVLMVGTTRPDWPAIAVLPPGYLPEEDLNALYMKIRKVLS